MKQRRLLHLTILTLLAASCGSSADNPLGTPSGGPLALANGATCFGLEPTMVLVPGGKGTNGTTFKGTNGNDVILGTEGDDKINGAGGNDLICGLGGNDNLTGGPGDDSIDGGDGNDNLSGGPGDDWIDGGNGDDTINGGIGADLLYGGAGVDMIFGAEDDDGIFGGDGNDHLQGGGGADSLFGGAGNDLMRGSGRRGADGGDRMFGEDGDDTMLGDVGDDHMDGGPGDDVILGNEGDDFIDGGADSDQCIGGGQAGDVLTNCELFDAPGIAALKDSFLRSGRANKNEGINPVLNLRADGDHRAVLDFGAFSTVDLTSATLVLTIAHNADNWGVAGRTIDAHPLLVDFTEGNGKNLDVPGPDQTDGTGAAVTWNCPTDTDVTNGVADCVAQWAGGTFGAATAASFLITNGLSGEVTFDVTADALAGSTRWLVRKTLENQAGEVGFHSREGATDLMNPALTPRLILEYAP